MKATCKVTSSTRARRPAARPHLVSSAPLPDRRGWFDGVGPAWTVDNHVLEIGSRLGQVRLAGDSHELSVPGGGPALAGDMRDLASTLIDDVYLVGKLLSNYDSTQEPLDRSDTTQVGYMLRRYSRMILTLTEAAEALGKAVDVAERRA
jgi:hypothetical protein